MQSKAIESIFLAEKYAKNAQRKFTEGYLLGLRKSENEMLGTRVTDNALANIRAEINRVVQSLKDTP